MLHVTREMIRELISLAKHGNMFARGKHVKRGKLEKMGTCERVFHVANVRNR